MKNSKNRIHSNISIYWSCFNTPRPLKCELRWEQIHRTKTDTIWEYKGCVQNRVRCYQIFGCAIFLYSPRHSAQSIFTKRVTLWSKLRSIPLYCLMHVNLMQYRSIVQRCVKTILRYSWYIAKRSCRLNKWLVEWNFLLYITRIWHNPNGIASFTTRNYFPFFVFWLCRTFHD